MPTEPEIVEDIGGLDKNDGLNLGPELGSQMEQGRQRRDGWEG